MTDDDFFAQPVPKRRARKRREPLAQHRVPAQREIVDPVAKALRVLNEYGMLSAEAKREHADKLAEVPATTRENLKRWRERNGNTKNKSGRVRKN